MIQFQHKKAQEILTSEITEKEKIYELNELSPNMFSPYFLARYFRRSESNIQHIIFNAKAIAA